MKRAVFLITPEQRQKVRLRAKNDKISTAEVHRRALDFYCESTKEDMEALSLLADVLVESNNRAARALTQAEKTLDAFLKTKRK